MWNSIRREKQQQTERELPVISDLELLEWTLTTEKKDTKRITRTENCRNGNIFWSSAHKSLRVCDYFFVWFLVCKSRCAMRWTTDENIWEKEKNYETVAHALTSINREPVGLIEGCEWCENTKSFVVNKQSLSKQSAFWLGLIIFSPWTFSSCAIVHINIDLEMSDILLR